MGKSLKTRLGQLKRGVFGFIKDKTEKTHIPTKNIDHFQIGFSGKHTPINCYRINNGPIKILFVAAIHGNEVGTVKFGYHLLSWLFANQKSFTPLTLYLIPCLNQDGYKLAKQNPNYFIGGRVGRFNSNQVDLNRNFDTPSFQEKSTWSFGKNYSQQETVYCGQAPGSEPETKALTKLILDQEIKVLFMIHNTGQDVMGNLNQLSQTLAKLYSEKTGFRLVDNEEWEKLSQSGTAKEWCELNNIAYIEVEGSTRWGSDWKKQKGAIESMLRYLADNK